MIYVDPINNQKIAIKSICIPSKTLLQGKEYSRAVTILDKNFNTKTISVASSTTTTIRDEGDKHE